MMERTFGMIKPDGIQKRVVGEVIKRLEGKKLEIEEIKKIRMSPNQFRKLYPHVYTKYIKIAKPLFKFITKNEVIVLLIRGDNAISKTQKLRGPSNPALAPGGTIRGDFARDQNQEKLYKQGKITRNIFHSSDNKKQAEYEIKIFFKER